MNLADMLARADRSLSAAPVFDRIERPEPHGEVVARFALPLELCPTGNHRDSTKGHWWISKLKRSVALAMLAQSSRQREPLPGRPQVLCVRFSSVEPDRYADWAKHAIDTLCVPTPRSPCRLGFLRDDRPRDAEVHQWWEPAPKGQGFVYIEVRTGGES